MKAVHVAIEKSQTLFTQFKENPPFSLPWSHYLILMRIKDENERKFYEIEAAKSQWLPRFFASVEEEKNAKTKYYFLKAESKKEKIMKLVKLENTGRRQKVSAGL